MAHSVCRKRNMNLHFQTREKEGIRILDLQGPLKAGESEASLRTAIIGLAEANVVNIVLDLAGVTKIDADGLAALVFCAVRVRRSGGALKLANVDRHRFSPALLARLDARFELFADEQDAVNSFFPDRAIHRYDILDWVREAEKR